MRVVITGAASFIGSAVVRKLLDEGDTVCAVVRPGSESTANFKRMLAREYLQALVCPGIDDINANGRSETADESSPVVPAIKVVELDLREIDKLPALLSQTQVVSKETSGMIVDAAGWDVFLHAGWEGAGSANREREDLQNANVDQTIAALRTAAALGCRRFIFTGSQAEYGIVEGLASEDTPTHPVSPYGKAKVAVSRAALPLSRELGIEYVHTRLYSVYGPGDHPWSLVNSCLKAWREGKIIELGPCTQQWNFLYVDDAAEALCTLMRQGEPSFYNIGSNDTRLLADYIREMARICHAEGLYVFGDRPQNAEGAVDLIPDIGKIEHDTSWRPKTSFKDGISKMWETEG